MTQAPPESTLNQLADLVSSLRDEVRQLRTEVDTLRRGIPAEISPAESNGHTPAKPRDAPSAPSRRRPPSPPSGVLGPRTYEIVFDGGSLGNPGRGYGSYILFGPDGTARLQKLDYAALGPRVTNNQAEYLTLIRAIESLRDELGSDAAQATVSIWGDSSLVVNQVNGTWKVKNLELQPLVEQAKAALSGFGTWTIRWHDRAKSVRLLGH